MSRPKVKIVASDTLTCTRCKRTLPYTGFWGKHLTKKGKDRYVPKKPVLRCMDCLEKEAEAALKAKLSRKQEIEKKLLETGEWHDKLDKEYEAYCEKLAVRREKPWRESGLKGCLFKDAGNMAWEEIKFSVKDFRREKGIEDSDSADDEDEEEKKETVRDIGRGIMMGAIEDAHKIRKARGIDEGDDEDEAVEECREAISAWGRPKKLSK